MRGTCYRWAGGGCTQPSPVWHTLLSALHSASAQQAVTCFVVVMLIKTCVWCQALSVCVCVLSAGCHDHQQRASPHHHPPWLLHRSIHTDRPDPSTHY